MGHLEVLTEEPSMEAFLKALLPRMLPARSTFNIHVFRGKHDLLRKLPSRLRGYAAWMPESYRVVVVVDRDNDDCCSLKAELEAAAAKSGLISRSQAGAGAWQVVNRIAIEELEAWYFGDWKPYETRIRAFCPIFPTDPAIATLTQSEAARGRHSSE